MSDEKTRAGANPALDTQQLLEDDIAQCRRLLSFCAQQAIEEEMTFELRLAAMATAAKLMRANASAAAILARAQATTHHVVVDHPVARPKLERRSGPEVEAEMNRIADAYYRRKAAEGDTSSKNRKTTSPDEPRIRKP
jgi:hypothetical protein